MDPLTYEAVTKNPALMQALLHQARRERAEAIHRLIIVPLRKLLSRYTSRPQVASAA